MRLKTEPRLFVLPISRMGWPGAPESVRTRLASSVHKPVSMRTVSPGMSL